MARRSTAAAAALLTLALAWVGLPAVAATPASPVLVGPDDGSTAGAVDVPLAVRAADPDGDAVDVRLEGRRLGATVPGPGAGGPFTLVALPDTQNYTYSGRQGTMTAQARWAVDSRAQLGTAMVVQLGDLVSNYDRLNQWDLTSAALKVLDDAGMPNTVVAGNHDFDNATGAFTQYDSYFPPTRYSGATWTPASARYGGYLGQNLFGPDPVDQRNMDNFALFTAGGRDFLVLNLEWEAPQPALDWATKVLAAHPDRTAIMVTHSFVGLTGQRRATAERPGGTSPKLWTDFVSQQCSIKLVLNGHYHSGDVGEANRSDLNRCGQPVQQILTDYQDRPNGGDGWLRYYTFDPAASTMTATTYSPTLQRFETDADSSFTVPFDLGASPQTAPFTTIATSRVASGDVARATWTGLAPGTTYEWRAVADDGTSTATSPTWTVRTPTTTDLVDDGFDRDVSNGWGAADATHAWQLTASPTAYRVGGGLGRMTAPAGSSRNATLTGVSASDVRVDADVSLEQPASGSGAYVSVLARARGDTAYRAKLRYAVGGSMTLSLGRTVSGAETTFATTSLPGLTASPGVPLRVRLEATGSSPTTLRAKAWYPTSAEPAAWAVTSSDATAGLQSPGSAGLDLYTSSGATSPSTLAVDRFTASAPSTTAPVNQKPVAVIATPRTSGRTVDLSSSGSTDPDGSVVSQAWDFGDGATASGSTTQHTYADDGTYTVTLVVTDDKGGTAQATRQVSVAAPASPGTLARDAFERTTTGGWGSAEVGGAWTTTGSAARYSVSGGGARQSLSSPGSSADAALPTVSSSATDLRLTLAWDRTATAGTLYAHVLPLRVSSTTDYRCRVIAYASGTTQLLLVRRLSGTEVTLATSTVKGLSVVKDQPYRVACRTTPSGSSTVLAGKVWRTDAPEPVEWLSATDTTAALQTAGGVGVGTYESGSATTGVTTTMDDLVVSTP